MNDQERRNLLWAAVEKIAAKEFRRDLLEPGPAEGARHQIKNLCITASVKGRPVSIGGDVSLCVNPDSIRASSAAPPYAALVGHLLGLLTDTVRRVVLDELPDQFAREGAIPEVSGEHRAAAESLLARLRARTTQSVRGSIAVTYQLD
jgi:hypothetical protein